MSWLYVSDGFRIHAAPEAIQAKLDTLRHKRRRIEQHMDELVRLRAIREQQIAAGEWPVAPGVPGPTDKQPERRRRLLSCVEQWDNCATGEYSPLCCRFPKSCSCTVYDDDIAEWLLEPRSAGVETHTSTEQE